MAFYRILGKSYYHKKKGKLEYLLQPLKPQVSIPWLYAWDFNEILKQNEKIGAAKRPYK